MPGPDDFPVCRPPSGVGDVVPLLVVAAAFMLGAWLLRWWRGRRSGR